MNDVAAVLGKGIETYFGLSWFLYFVCIVRYGKAGVILDGIGCMSLAMVLTGSTALSSHSKISTTVGMVPRSIVGSGKMNIPGAEAVGH